MHGDAEGNPITRKLRSACDACHSAKIRCSANGPPCQKCAKDNLNCHYSYAAKAGKPRGSKNRKTLQRLGIEAEAAKRSTNGNTIVAQGNHQDTVRSASLQPRADLPLFRTSAEQASWESTSSPADFSADATTTAIEAPTTSSAWEAPDPMADFSWLGSCNSNIDPGLLPNSSPALDLPKSLAIGPRSVTSKDSSEKPVTASNKLSIHKAIDAISQDSESDDNSDNSGGYSDRALDSSASTFSSHVFSGKRSSLRFTTSVPTGPSRDTRSQSQSSSRAARETRHSMKPEGHASQQPRLPSHCVCLQAQSERLCQLNEIEQRERPVQLETMLHYVPQVMEEIIQCMECQMCKADTPAQHVAVMITTVLFRWLAQIIHESPQASLNISLGAYRMATQDVEIFRSVLITKMVRKARALCEAFETHTQHLVPAGESPATISKVGLFIQQADHQYLRQCAMGLREQVAYFEGLSQQLEAARAK